MSGMLRKMGEYFGFSGTEYDLEEEYSEEYPGGEYAPAYAPQRAGYDQGAYADPEYTPERGRGRFSSSVQVQHPRSNTRVEPQRRPAPAPMAPEPPVQIRTIHPTSYNDAKQMGELVRHGQAVIMNLSELNDDLARRLVDFGAGLTFGLGGSIDRVTHRVFLMSPPNVSVSAEDRARIAEGGFFNQS